MTRPLRLLAALPVAAVVAALTWHSVPSQAASERLDPRLERPVQRTGRSAAGPGQLDSAARHELPRRRAELGHR